MPLIVLNVIVFVCCRLGSSGESLENILVLHPYYIRHFQIWRLFTYMFVHGDFFHILCNMWGVYMFGRPVERLLGTRRFLILYFVSGLIGALAWLALNFNNPFVAFVSTHGGIGRVASENLAEVMRLAPDTKLLAVSGSVVGASGALFGILVAAAMAFPNVLVSLIFPPVTMKLRTMVIIYMVIEIVQSFNAGSNIAHLAHLGGALGGFLFMRRLRQIPGMSIWSRIARLFRRENKNEGRFVNLEIDRDEVLRIVEKMSKYGYDSLTPQEKRILITASKDRNGY